MRVCIWGFQASENSLYVTQFMPFPMPATGKGACWPHADPCWPHADPMLALCLSPCPQRVNVRADPVLTRCWPDADRLPTLRWHYADPAPTLCRHCVALTETYTDSVCLSMPNGLQPDRRRWCRCWNPYWTSHVSSTTCTSDWGRCNQTGAGCRAAAFLVSGCAVCCAAALLVSGWPMLLLSLSLAVLYAVLCCAVSCRAVLCSAVLCRAVPCRAFSDSNHVLCLFDRLTEINWSEL